MKLKVSLCTSQSEKAEAKMEASNDIKEIGNLFETPTTDRLSAGSMGSLPESNTMCREDSASASRRRRVVSSDRKRSPSASWEPMVLRISAILSASVQGDIKAI